MALPKSIVNVSGAYTGASSLHMPWMPEGEQILSGPSTIEVVRDRHNTFATLRYTWTYQGETHEGTMIVTANENGETSIGWSDSWHQNSSVMRLTGSSQDGSVSCPGSYPAPEGPDWGWRIALEGPSTDSFKLTMFNIMPDGQEMLAVEGEYKRSAK